MRTRRTLYPQTSEMYICELDQCPLCGEQLELSRYSSGHKIVQNLSSTVEVGYWPKQCDSPGCTNYGEKWRSSEWQQIAPMYCTYGFDVITTIGWQRQASRCTFEEIHSDLAGRITISEARHAFCQLHYLKNIAEPAASADETMKVELRKTVRENAGEIIRPEHLKQPGVLTVTGLLPSAVAEQKASFFHTPGVILLSAIFRGGNPAVVALVSGCPR
ncbi:hypothetical protein DespoDRAFT_03174 [Desulfobacter postgatei 2ac9]|uniref:Uncharacterized protein n=2 Tax=Desulfobacter postgatei TaxID=2293 RepID=I5B648_9BACT|nr:hypothetical protein DespoDRAFT_03174 [Desulfobacter postgatei 2ac9]